MKRLLNLYNPGGTRFRQTFSPELLAELHEMVDFHTLPTPLAANIKTPAGRDELYNADILLTGWGSPLLPNDLLMTGKVRYICHVTGAVRGVIPRELFQEGAVITNWGNSISRTIAEAALMMILGCLRRVRPTQEELHNRGGFRSVPVPHSLFERTVGLFGFGAIARELVPLLRPFHVNIKAYDPYVPAERFAEYGVQHVPDLRTLFSECDIISVHAAKTPDTFGVVNKDVLSLLPDDGVLVNTSRGSLLNEADLAEQLEAGRLWAALDVYEPEPISADSPLRGQERILLFPHTAGPTVDRLVDMGRLAVDNIRRFLADEPVLHRVTVEQYDLMT